MLEIDKIVRLKEILLEEKQALVKQLEALTVHVDTNELADDIDAAIMDSNHYLNSRMADRNRSATRKIDAALRRIEDGDYGVCEDCSDDIEFRRLLARPTATLCVSCKHQREIEEGTESRRAGRSPHMGEVGPMDDSDADSYDLAVE